MSGYGNRRRRPAKPGGAGSRWMPLRYPGVCKVCADPIGAGETGYWDSAGKTVTCFKMECAEADNLTVRVTPTGPWDGPGGVLSRLPRRLGSPAPVNPLSVRFPNGAEQLS